jgi:RNA polymerase sigma-70 factor (ECF subfamily)
MRDVFFKGTYNVNPSGSRMNDPIEFEAFMRDYQNMVFTTASRLLADETESQDIAQEVFLKAYERFDELKSSPTAGGWLKTVTRNLCLNLLSRHRSRWKLFSEFSERGEDESRNESYEDRFSASNISYPELETTEQRALLSVALNRLPEAQRVPLVLFHIEEMSYQEIANKLKISLSKVKVDIHRGRLALRQILNHYPECRTA